MAPEQLSEDESSLAKCLLEKYGVKAKVFKRLDGINDITYRVNEDYVLRVMVCTRTSNSKLIEAEANAITFLKDNNFPVAEVMKTLDGNLFTYADVTLDAGGRTGEKRSRPIRLQKFLNGQLWYDTSATTTTIGKAAGEFMGRVDIAFQNFHSDFYKESAENDLFYIIRLNDVVDLRKLIKFVENDEKRFKQIKRVIQLFNERVQPFVNELPKQQIHGDGHWRNMMVNDDCTEIVGLVDFGDSRYTCRIYELGISLATLFKAKSFELAESFCRGYMSQVQLTEQEKLALFPCVLCRVSLFCLGLIFLKKAGRSLDEYANSVGGDGWTTIDMLLEDYDNANRFQAMFG